MDRIIELAMSQSWIYNQSWEDPAVDIKHFKIGKGDRICMLTTGGDNVLDYLVEDPEYIDTFDMNEHQNYLMDMKLALVKALEHEECFAILARQDYDVFLKHYSSVRKHLSEESAVWWDANKANLKNWHLSGSCKYAAKTAVTILNLLGCKGMMEEFQKMPNPTLEEQRKIYDKYRGKVQFAANLCQTAISALIGCVGVPQRQFRMYDEKESFLPELMDYLCKDTLLFHDNYFYSSYLADGWTEQCCPRYLKKEYFYQVKERALEGRVKIITSTLADGVVSPAARGRYTRFVLLDHQDWLPEELIVKTWSTLAKVGDKDPENRPLVGWRSFGYLPFGCLSNLKYHVRGEIGRKEVNEYSDRVGMYNGLFCAELPVVEEAPVVLADPKWNMSFWRKLKTFADMTLAPVTTMLSRGHSEFLDSFYSSQAENYDAYRALMLHGKKDVMWSTPWNSKPKRVLLFGGGTGDALEYIRDLVREFEEVVVLDLCGPLLKEAQKRANKYGWDNVKIVQGDATNPELLQAGSFDVVVSTYVFTMIPDWKKAMDVAWGYVAPGGYLSVADFTTNPKHQSRLFSYFWRTCFSFDHVNLNSDHQEYIRNLGTGCAFRIEEGDFPFIPVLTCPYYYAVQQKAGKKED